MVYSTDREFIIYAFTTGLIFFLFFFLISIFGFFILTLIRSKILKVESSIPKYLDLFLGYGIGTSIFISISFILMAFRIFNFLFAYTPYIIIDTLFIISRFRKNEFRISKARASTSKNPKRIFIIIITLIIPPLLLINLLWPILSESKALIYKDPYYFLQYVYVILESDGIKGFQINPLYPPGFSCYCAGSLLIFEDYLISYYYLKFGGIYVIILFILLMYGILFNIFKKIYIAFIGSIFLISFYLYIFNAIAFTSDSTATFFFSITSVLFLGKKKELLFNSFFLSLIFLLNPATLFFYLSLLILFFLINILIFDNQNFSYNIRLICSILIVFILLVLIYISSLMIMGKELGYLVRAFYQGYMGTIFNGKIAFLNPISSNIIGINLFLLEGEKSNLVLNFVNSILNQNISIYLIVIVFIMLFTFFGFINYFLYNNRRFSLIHSSCIFALILIIAFYFLLIFVVKNNSYFFITFTERVWRIYAVFIIILSCFGISFIEKCVNKMQKFLHDKWLIYKVSEKSYILQSCRKKINLKDIFIVLLIVSSITLQLEQKNNRLDWVEYDANDEIIDAVLYLRMNLEPRAKILYPYNNIGETLSSYILDPNVIMYSAPEDESIELEAFNEIVVNSKIDYLLLEKNYYDFGYNSFSDHDSYELIFENERYIAYRMKYD